MKKRWFIFIAVLAVMTCLLAICASADTVKPSDSNAYGELTTFDEAIGNTAIGQEKDDGTIARAVLFDGEKYYTVPTTYILTENTKSTGEILKFNFSEINSKLSVTFDKTKLIRCEIPSGIDFVAGANEEKFNGCTKLIEITVNDGLGFYENNQYKAFAECKALTEIDISMMVIEYDNSTYSLFEYCENLEKIILPKEPYVKNGVAVSYKTNYMFNGCKKLKEIENLAGFLKGTKTVAHKMFADCYVLKEVELWEGLTGIDGKSFSNCRAITSIIIPDTVTYIGTDSSVFDSCTSLKTIVMSQNITSLGTYCFEKCTALEKVWMPAPWVNNSEAKLKMSNQIFGQAEKSGVVFYLMCSEEEMASYIDQSAYTSDNKTDAWKHGTFVYNATLKDKCDIFLGAHTLSSTHNDCTADISCERCNTVLSEAFDEHELVVTIVYNDGLCSVGVKTTACTNSEICTVKNVTVEAPAIFSAKGYSYKESGGSDGLCGGFSIDLDALSDYRSANPDAKISVSMVIVNPKYLDTNAFFDESGRSTASGGVIQVELTELVYSSYDYKVSGFNLDYMQNLELCFAMVVCDDVNGVEILQKQYSDSDSSPIKNTYTDNVGVTLSAVTVESIAPDVVAALKEQENF